MGAGEWIAFGALCLTIIVYILRVGYLLNKKVSYESFDRFKKEVMENCVHKEVFQLSHDQIKTDISEIKVDVKSLLRKANGTEK
jgi:hypothetical protein